MGVTLSDPRTDPTLYAHRGGPPPWAYRPVVGLVPNNPGIRQPKQANPTPPATSSRVSAMPRIDPGFAVHRGLPAIGWPIGSPGTVRAPDFQEAGGRGDYDMYPHKDSAPSALAKANNPPAVKGVQHTNTDHRNDGPQGFDFGLIDYGKNPDRIPRLWRDSNREWDGLDQHGFQQQNYRIHLRHLIPAAPTRGLRSVSGVVTATGPTGSRARIPAIFVPSSVS